MVCRPDGVDFQFCFRRSGKTTAPGLVFTGPEIFPIDQQISLLHAADLNGDGLNDLIVANNLRSKIMLLYNQTGKTNLKAAVDSSQPLEINQLPPGSRFRIDSIPVDEHISAMVVTDLNGDGKPDIAFYGDGKDLEVVYNQGTNGWSDPKRWHIDNGRTDANALAEGDLNGDGRTDLVLLGDNGSLYFLPQLADHTLGEPQKIAVFGHTGGRANRGRERRWPERFVVGGLGQPDAVSFPVAKRFRPARPGDLFQITAHPLLYVRTIWKGTPKITWSPSRRTPAGRRFHNSSANRPSLCPAPFARDNSKSCR